MSRIASWLAVSIVGVAVTMCWLSLSGAPARADESPVVAVVRIDPPTQAAVLGQVVGIDVYVADVTNLYGADISLAFDPTLLSVVDARPNQAGVQVTLGPLLKPDFVLRNTADNVGGTVTVTVVQLNPTLPVTGSNVFMHVTFQTLAIGDSPVHLSSVELADRDGIPMETSTEDGHISVLESAGYASYIWLPIIRR